MVSQRRKVGTSQTRSGKSRAERVEEDLEEPESVGEAALIRMFNPTKKFAPQNKMCNGKA